MAMFNSYAKLPEGISFKSHKCIVVSQPFLGDLGYSTIIFGP